MPFSALYCEDEQESQLLNLMFMHIIDTGRYSRFSEQRTNIFSLRNLAAVQCRWKSFLNILWYERIPWNISASTHFQHDKINRWLSCFY